MRFLSVLLLFCLATSLAVGSEPSGFGTKWATAFKSFFGHEDTKIAVQADSAEDSVHARLKRAVYAAMGWTLNCNNGWTGTYCQIPVCPGDPSPPIRTSIGYKLVDKIDLGVGCSQSYVIPVEANVERLALTIDTQYGRPQVILLDDNNFQVDVGGAPAEGHGAFTVNFPQPGLYSVSVNLSNAQTTPYCRVTVEVYAVLDVLGGFVSSPQQDRFEDQLLYSSNPSFFVAHVANVTAPGSLGAVYLRSNRSNFFDFTSVLSPRYSCNYEYYAGYFTCQFGSTYQWVVDGVDGYGYRFRRSKDFYCLNQPVTQGPPTTTAVPPSSCLNGGTLVNSTSTPFCYCGTFFTGPTCAERVCMHNGNPTENGCDCPSGYTGPFCEHISCSTDVFGGFNTDEKTLIVVIRQSPFIATQVNLIAQAIQEQINYHAVSGVTVYSWFILVSFSNDNIKWQEYSTSTDFLTNLVLLNTTNVQTGCNDTVIDAIASVFEVEIISAKSPIIVITDAPPDDGADYLTVINRNTFRKLPIFVFYINNPSGSCNTDQMSAGYRALQALAHSTGGLVMTPDLNSLPNAFKYTMRFTTYHSNMVLGYDYFQCSMGNHGSFFVDTSVKRIAILATGSNLTITVTDPNGNSSMVIDAAVTDPRVFIWDITGDVIPGEYLFFITSTSGATQPCNYRVYVESNYDLFYGVSNSLTTDAYYSEPIYRQSSNMVATFNGLRGQIRDQFRLYAEMQISRYNASGALEPVYFSSGVYRDGCNYHLSFGSFVCDVPNEHLYMTVFADDPFGFPIQRSAVIYCAYEQPTVAPPNSCINGGVTNPQNTSTCLCPAHWTGQYCQNIVCENNGTAIANTYCQCPEYTAGRFCEETSCGSPASGVNFRFTHRSLALVLNVHNSMAAPLLDIANNIQNFVRDLFIMHNLFITKFIVVTYNETMAMTIKVSDDPRSFIAAVQYAAEQAQSASPINPNNATGLLDTGIKLALDESLPQSYVFAFTDAESSQDPSSDATLAWNTLNAQDLRINLNLVAVSNSISGGVNGYQFIPEHIYMVEYTEGEVFYTTHPGNFLQYIPTLYKSGLMSGGSSNNCNITRFLPIDYWSQAFTIYTGGANVSVKVTPPKGSAADYENIIDQDQYLDIRQYIIPCDTSNGYWSPLGQYCYNFNTEILNYSSAVVHCHDVRDGHLIHIFNQETQDYVNTKVGQAELWLGLKRLGSTWVWDAPGFVQLNLTLTGYTNWDPSINPSDPSQGDCVVLKQGTDLLPRWFVVQCSESHLTMCQKHRYNQEFEPGSDNNLLPAGIWRVDITGTGPCGMEARIQSEIQIFYGFTTDLHSDDPQTYANLLTDQNRIIAHTTGLEPINPDAFEDNVDGHLNYAFMYVNSTMVRVARFQPRVRCAYRAVSQTFKCPQYGANNTLTEMPIRFSGIDQFGNLFERVGTPYCANTIVSCYNEGYLYNGFCICRDNFEGDRCQNRICRNGGFLEPNGQCRCPEETTGDSCETFVCIPPRQADFSQNNKTLAILFETSYGMTVTQLLLSKKFVTVMQNVTSQTSSRWFSNYIFYPFDSTSDRSSWYDKVYTTNPLDIQNAFNYPTYQCPGGNTCESGPKCPRPILSVINDTLNDPQFASGSVILLITQSTVEDITQYTSVYANIQRKRAQINIILPDVSSPCSLPWTDFSNRVLFSLPEASGGNLFTLLSRDINNVLLPTYLPTLYKGNVVDSLTRRNCTYDEIYVSVDTQTTEFTIVYSGLSPTVSVTDPKNQTTTLPANLLSSVFNYYAIYPTNKIGGTYKVTAQSNSAAGACLINVHSTSEISVFAGYTVAQDAYNGATSDDAHSTAISDPSVKNVVLLHATNLNGGYLNYVQMYTTQNFGRPQLWTAEVKPRSTNCSYEYYSVGGFTCDVPGTYLLAVYGVDGNGYNFRRSIPVDCVSDRPPRDPTPPTCNLHDRFYDIILILDGSTVGAFQQLKSIASSAFSPYAYNFQFTRLSIIVVNANATLQGYLKDSDGKQGPQIVALANSTNNSTGQDLDSALQLIISEAQNPDTSGYRADARHLIVYMTHNVAFSSDPQNTLNSIKRGGMFGFVGIGYNLEDNDAATLTNLSGDRCTYNGYGPNASTFIQYFIQDITCFRFPVCGE